MTPERDPDYDDFWGSNGPRSATRRVARVLGYLLLALLAAALVALAIAVVAAVQREDEDDRTAGVGQPNRVPERVMRTTPRAPLLRDPAAESMAARTSHA